MQKFSVLLSVYKKERPEWLRESLASVFRQTAMPAEVVLVQDGPLTEELEAVIRECAAEHPELKTVPLTTNVGLGRALNAGLRHCSHELVARMDTDDICKPWRFERQLQVFEEKPETDVCGAWMEEFSGNTNNILSVKKLPENSDELFLYGKKRNPVNHPVTMFRKTAVTDNGGYRHYPLFEDYFLWVRMLTNGCHFYTIQESLQFFRVSGEMYARRRGLRYALTEVRLQFLFFGLRYIGFGTFLANIAIRFTARIMPRRLLAWFYRKKLRQ